MRCACYFRFPLSLRMVEDMLAARGIIVTPQTIRGNNRFLLSAGPRFRYQALGLNH